MKPVYLVTGSDWSAIRGEAAKVVGQLTGGSDDAFALEVYKESDDKNPEEIVSDLLSSLKTPSFLGGSKTVWLQHVGFLASESTARDKKKDPLVAALAQLAAFIADAYPDDIQLVISGAGASPAKPLYKACSSVGKVLQFTKPDLRQRNWRRDVQLVIRRELDNRGMVLSPASVDYLVEVVGVDTERIACEIEKLICYAGERPTYDEVATICVGNREAVFYALSNAVGERNIAAVFKTISQILGHSRDPENLVVGQVRFLARFFTELLHAKVLMSVFGVRYGMQLPDRLEHLSSDERGPYTNNLMFTKKAGQMKMIAKQAERFTGQELVHAINLLADADRRLVSSNLSNRLILEKLTLEICSRGVRA